MVVLYELEGHQDNTMLGSSGPNQYIQPDYLGPLPSTLDSKQSPLALLAMTCSSIGSDSSSTPSSKGLLDASKRKSSTCSDNSNKSSSVDGDSHSSSNNNRPKSSSSTVSNSNSNNSTTKENGNKLQNGKISPGKVSPPLTVAAFRPYEKEQKVSPTNNMAEERKKDKEGRSKEKRSNVTPPLNSSEGNKEPKESKDHQHVTREERKRPAHSGSGSSSSSSSNSGESKKSRHDSNPSSTKTHNPSSSSPSPKDQGASPIIRSGLEVLQGDYRKLAASAFGMYPPPPGFDPGNPAFRPPFFGGVVPQHSHPFPPTGSPYIGYSRVKSASGAESIVPVCKDPYCTGCQFGGQGQGAHSSSAAALMAAAGFSFPPTSSASSASSSSAPGFCPAGCVHQCEHQKIPFPTSSSSGLPMPPSFFPSLLPTSSAAAAYTQSALSTLSQHSAAAAAAQRPYVCNWIVGESYCGKRFTNSEELLQHLRSHPNNSTQQSSPSDNAALAAMIQQQQAQAYSNLLANSSMASLAMHNRTYPTPPLSPLSAARYNPYAMAAMAQAKGLFPPPPLGLYAASPYSSLYGQKIPQVHP